jgi:transposase-like protein
MEMASVLSEKYFHDEAAAFAQLEAIMWPEGPTCPHCGSVDRINRLQGVKDKRGNVRPGLWKCYHCRSQFTVRKGSRGSLLSTLCGSARKPIKSYVSETLDAHDSRVRFLFGRSDLG